MDNPHGMFVWYELMTTDLPAAEAFYAAVMGWKAVDSQMPGVTYTLFKVGDVNAAGGMAMPPGAGAGGMRPGWIGYVAVDDVDARAAQVAAAGGAVHRAPDDIPGVGRFAMVADPQGAVLALFKPLPDPQAAPAAPGTPGHGGWRELLAADWQAAFDYYSGLFGWTKGDPFDMGPMGIYQLFNSGDRMIGGMMTKPDSVPASFWLYYFNVTGIDAAVERVKAAGGQVVSGPHEVPGGSWIIQATDPQGAMFGLLAPTR